MNKNARCLGEFGDRKMSDFSSDCFYQDNLLRFKQERRC